MVFEYDIEKIFTDRSDPVCIFTLIDWIVRKIERCTMGRPKKYNTPYTGDKQQMEAAFQEYVSCVADCFGEPYDDRNFKDEKRDTVSLRSVCEEFSISIPKARKLLITAGVYSTEQSRRVAELSAEGKNVAEMMTLTGLSRSSVSSYVPYQRFSYNMDECSRHAEDSRKYRERQRAVGKLQERIKNGAEEILENGILTAEELDEALWQCVIAYQNYPFHTPSGLPFSYNVKQGNDEYGGELVVSRKEESETLTRSSILLAFHKVLEGIKTEEVKNKDGVLATTFILPEFKEPKAIGQILYSLLWKWGLIQVPEKVEDKLKGKRK